MALTDYTAHLALDVTAVLAACGPVYSHWGEPMAWETPLTHRTQTTNNEPFPQATPRIVAGGAPVPDSAANSGSREPSARAGRPR